MRLYGGVASNSVFGKEKVMKSFLRDKEKWQEIRKNPQYKPILDALFAEYERSCKDKEIPLIKFSDEMDFTKTGDRTRFNEKYFLCRKQLSVYAILCMIYPENPEYLEKLEDVICAICNEYSWQISAHRSRTDRNKRDGLSLFSCETGLYIAEIKEMLIDRLDSLVIERMTAEIDKRILKSFENSHNLWIETLKSNWAAVCGGSIGVTFMYESPGRFKNISTRIDAFMKNYLEGISDDGGTSEGADYWNYGFCFYAMYFDMFSRYIRGIAAGFETEKVRKMANFYSSVYLNGKNMVSFSDSSEEGGYHMWLIHFLKKKFDIVMPPAESAYIDFEKFSAAVRAFLYYEPSYLTDSIKAGKAHFEKLGWYIERKEKYGFAIKAGNNGEEHNHNDIGSFIVANKRKQILCDLGAAQYTSANFGKDRYSIFNNSSLGHSVPIVNGSGQGSGKEFYGTLAVSDKISVDMKNAYPERIEKLIRTVELKENSVTLTDKFSGIYEIKERFVTEEKPIISDNSIILDGATLSFDADWKPICSEKIIKAHNGKDDRKVYILDLKPKTKTEKFNLYINF